MGIWPATNQHPALGVILVRLIFSLGRHVNDNFGVFLFVALQSVVTALVFSWSVRSVRDLSESLPLALVCLLYYAVVPVWGSYAQTFIKDTLFYAVYLAFFIQLIKMLVAFFTEEGAQARPREWAALCALGTLACLLRHGETMVVLPTLLATAVAMSGQRDRFFLSAVVVLVLTTIIGKLLVAYIDAGPILSREIYSIPFQQTARYMHEYPDEVTDEEFKAIDVVLSAEKIADAYDPLISDDVKITYRPEATGEDMVRYFRVWFQMLQKHPRAYIDAFAQMTSGYLDPLHHVCPHPDYFFWVKGEPTATGDFSIAQVRTMEEQWALISFTSLWLKVPFLAWLEYPGFHTWIVLLCCARLFAARKGRYVAPLVCPLLQILVCIASPVASNIRYELPVMAISPVVIAWVLWASAAGGRDDGEQARQDSSTRIGASL